MFSILGNDQAEERKEDPEYIQDLNMDQLIGQLEKGYEKYEISQYYGTLLREEEEIRFRQQIMEDLERQDLFQGVKAFFHAIERAEEYESHTEDTSGDSRAHWHLAAAYTYYRAVDHLVGCLKRCSPQSEGWRLCLSMLEDVRRREEYRKWHDLAVDAYETLAGLRYSIRIEGDHVAVLPQVQEEDLIGGLRERFPEAIGMPEGLLTLLPGLESGKLETHIFKFLRKKNPGAFASMEAFGACTDFHVEEVGKLQREIAFYLSFCDFKLYMEYYGHAFCTPVFTRGEMNVRGGYDLALARKNREEGKKVVANDYYYGEKERFFVVTGPNQGGKTTFARSVGQLVFFSLLGLPVPAQKAELPKFDGLVTHFSVEESMESGRGKLKEELMRLAPMMRAGAENAFVIINELFTSAATLDASQMGRKVIEHFLGQDCHGIYVTHIEELAAETDQIVSMTASVEGGKRYLRTYKLKRCPADGRGYALSVVEQYGLSYEQILRRKEAGVS